MKIRSFLGGKALLFQFLLSKGFPKDTNVSFVMALLLWNRKGDV